ncbi:hypothetical protein GCM10023238_26470 [Streptomyces heliomycini]
MTPPVAADAVDVDRAMPVAAARAPVASNAESRTATDRLILVSPFTLVCRAFRTESLDVMGMSLLPMRGGG